ncbi:hypothetical protein Tco_1066418 [Tanacetum coccineum]|uniref:Uncharacterized protein n=1 Tax=Tanacetum coccineum TaxID=301880 RepID=A0ABQ5HBC1_9ASTR
MEVIPDEEEVAVDAIPLATKPPSIVDYKILKEVKISYYQIIRVDGSSKRRSSVEESIRKQSVGLEALILVITVCETSLAQLKAIKNNKVFGASIPLGLMKL